MDTSKNNPKRKHMYYGVEGDKVYGALLGIIHTTVEAHGDDWQKPISLKEMFEVTNNSDNFKFLLGDTILILTANIATYFPKKVYDFDLDADERIVGIKVNYPQFIESIEQFTHDIYIDQ